MIFMGTSDDSGSDDPDEVVTTSPSMGLPNPDVYAPDEPKKLDIYGISQKIGNFFRGRGVVYVSVDEVVGTFERGKHVPSVCANSHRTVGWRKKGLIYSVVLPDDVVNYKDCVTRILNEMRKGYADLSLNETVFTSGENAFPRKLEFESYAKDLDRKPVGAVFYNKTEAKHGCIPGLYHLEEMMTKVVHTKKGVTVDHGFVFKFEVPSNKHGKGDSQFPIFMRGVYSTDESGESVYYLGAPQLLFDLEGVVRDEHETIEMAGKRTISHEADRFMFGKVDRFYVGQNVHCYGFSEVDGKITYHCGIELPRFMTGEQVDTENEDNNITKKEFFKDVDSFFKSITRRPGTHRINKTTLYPDDRRADWKKIYDLIPAVDESGLFVYVKGKGDY